MLYKKYQMYNDSIEIMVPSHLTLTNSFLQSHYNWMSDDRRVVVNVAKGGSDLDEESLLVRLDEYYRGFCKDVNNFECLAIKKRRVNGRSYGEIRYNSEMTGYRFYNIFMLGYFEGAEIVVTLQCMHADIKAQERIFENISDSLRILRKKKIETGEKEYDS